MTDLKKLTINIIYVKGTVRSLIPFLTSLLKHSDCSYRLISNGCDPDEEQLLQDFADSELRAVFYGLKTKGILPHHEVLHQLLSMEESEWFAFMDSDIVATGQFLPDLMEESKGKQAVFTGLPVWHEQSEMSMPRSFRIMGGRYFQAHNSYLVGLSYAAIYHTEALRTFIKDSGIDLRKYNWKEIPGHYQNVLIDLDLKKQLYDTAKVLNIIWQNQGAIMAYKEVPTLIHLGGISGPAMHEQQTSGSRRKLSGYLPFSIGIALKSLPLRKGAISFKENRNLQRLIRKRDLSARLLRDHIYDRGDARTEDIEFLPEDVAAKMKHAVALIKPIVTSYYKENKLM